MVTDALEVQFNDALDQSSWYLFSVEMQKAFVVVMSIAQQPAAIRGYGNSLCARQSFKTVNYSTFVCRIQSQYIWNPMFFL